MLAGLDGNVAGHGGLARPDPPERFALDGLSDKLPGILAGEAPVGKAIERYLICAPAALNPRVRLHAHAQFEENLLFINACLLDVAGVDGHVVISGRYPYAVPAVAVARQVHQQRRIARSGLRARRKHRAHQRQFHFEIGQLGMPFT